MNRENDEVPMYRCEYCEEIKDADEMQRCGFTPNYMCNTCADEIANMHETDNMYYAQCFYDI